MKRRTRTRLGTRAIALLRCESEVIAAPVICSSVISSPTSVRTTSPRENTSTRSQRPWSSITSDESTTTASPLSAAARMTS